jgi:hypothetical protein
MAAGTRETIHNCLGEAVKGAGQQRDYWVRLSEAEGLVSPPGSPNYAPRSGLTESALDVEQIFEHDLSGWFWRCSSLAIGDAR